MACTCGAMDWQTYNGDSQMTTKPGRKPSGITSVYISVRLPLSIAQALHVLAASKKTSRNKLIGDVLRNAVASEVQE